MNDCYPYFCIASSDDDQPIVEDLAVEIDFSGNLAASITHTDYEDRRYSCRVIARVNSDNARTLARRYKMELKELPALIARSMRDYYLPVNPNFREIQAAFKEVIERFIDEGCRLRIIRIRGHKGYICC